MESKNKQNDIITEIIEFETPDSSRASRIVLFIFIILSFVLPIVGTVFVSIYMGFKLGIILSYLIFWATGIYFLKLYLWSKFGKEKLMLEPEKIIYIADYKLFKGNMREVYSKQFKIEVLESFDGNKEYGTLMVTDNNATIETVINLPVVDLFEIKKKIEKFYA